MIIVILVIGHSLRLAPISEFQQPVPGSTEHQLQEMWVFDEVLREVDEKRIKMAGGTSG